MLNFLDIVLNTSLTQFNLHEQQVVLLPSLVQCNAVFISRKLFIPSYFLQSLATVIFASVRESHLFDCIKFTVLFAAYPKYLSEASLTYSDDLIETLLKIRLILGLVIEAI